MLTSPDQSPTFPDLTLKEQQHTVKSWKVKRSTVTLPPLGQHAAARVDDLPSRPARDSDDLLSHRDSRERNSTSECKKAVDEDPMNGTCESPLDEYGLLPASDVASGGVRLETTSIRERSSCGRKLDADGRGKAEEYSGASLSERTTPRHNANCRRKHSMEHQDHSSPKQPPSSKGLNSLLESACVTTWSFLREVTIKSRVRGGIFKFFKMDSGSQIAPFPGAEDKDHSQRKPRGQIGGKEMGPGRPFLPWNRKRQASGSGVLGGAIAGTMIEDDLRLNQIGRWPEPLDDEPLATEWALDKSEGEVLAAAKRIGSILVRVVTWNLCARPAPGAEKLRDVLLPPGKFHIYAVGTEECQNSIAKSVIVHSKREWENLLKETLGASYEMLCGHALQATHNAVFAHRGLIPLLRNVRSSAVATGLDLGPPGMTLGNKGGVGISFVIGATSCIFVNSHLAAHQVNVRERNDQFFRISEGLARALGPPPSRTSLDASSATESSFGTATPFRPSAVVSGSPSKREGGSQGGVIQVKKKGHMGIRRTALPVGAKSKVVPVLSNQTQRPSARDLAEAKETDRLVPHVEESNSIVPPLDTTSLVSPPESITPSLRRRDGSYHINERIRVQKGVPWEEGRGGKCEGTGGGHRRTLCEVFDRVVWAGDLNYRVNVSRKMANVLLSKDLRDELIKNDQLLLEREKGDASAAPFAGYQEGPLNFRPTYKFDCGSDTYDSSPKQRVPAWTDRVLFAGAATRPGESCKKKGPEATVHGETPSRMHLRAYRSVPELQTSDHRPVLSSFVMEFDQREVGDRGSGEEELITNLTSSEICSTM